jgi:hypothetical protein
MAPVRLARRPAVAQDAVPRRGLDREADGFEQANELVHVLSHPFWRRFRVDGISSDEFAVASK